ncbi:MAG: malate dehydrogenase [Candidatus Moranbacteria bacterium RIFCSPHIGHO2_01_FULL_55_24]|nr:MAG: malate dehydrogenase [Candidatus Moranbacteria bacterium RIFCSPHIGHO2_01_FULL_55_24]
MTQKKNQKNTFGAEALRVHKKLGGKISIVPKAKIKDKHDLSIYYTPGVGAVSTHIAEKKARVYDYTMKKNAVAVVSDGSAVLGLGNIGPEAALPVMEGKAMLFKALADIDAVPLVLASQDIDSIVETVKNIAPGFGGINLEDIAAPQCFEIEARLRKALDIPVLHDDQHGTAMVVLAGLINALRVAKKKARQVRIVISGAGAAGQAITNFLHLYGVGDIIVTDTLGIVHKKRENLTFSKKKLAQITNKKGMTGDIRDALRGADVFIGVSKGNMLSAPDIALMAPRAIVFALSNPIPEIMPDEAKAGGALVVATGRSDFPNQINNALGFPGIFRGALDNGVKEITSAMLIQASENLAKIVKKPTAEKIVPSVFDKAVVRAVAKAIR